MGRVEAVEVSVLDPTMIEIGGGIGLGIEWGGILSFSLASYAN